MMRMQLAHEEHTLPTLLGNRQRQTAKEKPNAKGRSESLPGPRVRSSSSMAVPAKKLPGPPPMCEVEKDLMRAVFAGDLKTVRELLYEHGPSVLSGRGSGITPTAILHAAQAGNRDLCDLLIAHGGARLLRKGRDVKGQGPAEYAERAGHDQLAAHLKALHGKTSFELKKTKRQEPRFQRTPVSLPM